MKASHSSWKLYLKAFEAFLAKEKFQGDPKAPNLYTPIDYTMRMGGKRIRPTICLMAYHLFKDDYGSILPTAMALEVFHNFTLLHDDIMDEATLRRGKETVVEKFGLANAILSGDMMLIRAYQYLSAGKQTNQAEVQNCFNQTGQEVCEGQQLDMDFEQVDQVSLEDYKHMIAQKTSVLVAACAKIGALRADASIEEANLVYGFAKQLGIAFQLQDDLLDVYADDAKFGKKVGGDIIQKKKTFLMLSAMQSNRADEIKAIYDKGLDESQLVEQVKSIYNELGIDSKTKTEIAHHHQLAVEQLEALQVADERKKALRSLMDYLILRDY